MSETFEKSDIIAHETAPAAVAGHSSKHVDGDIQLLDANNKVQNIPIPTDSPRDPLNWSKTRKLLVIISCCWFSIMSLALVGNAGPLIPYWVAAYAPPPELVSRALCRTRQYFDAGPAAQKSISSIINLTTWPSLFTGVGNWIFMPLALLAGRRFSLLVAYVKPAESLPPR